MEERNITLVEAVHLVTTQNPNVQIGLIDAALAREDQRRALSALLPQVSVGMNERLQRINVETLIGTRSGFPQHEGPFQAVNVGTSFSVPLFNAANWQHYRAQGANRSAAVADANSVREQIVTLTVTQYLLCVRLAATVNAAESQAALADRLFQQASHQESAGAGTGLDTLRAEQRLKVQQQALIVAREDSETALFGLVRLLSLPPSTNVVLIDQDAFANKKVFAPEEASLEAAYAQRPEMIAVNDRLRAAHLEGSGARGERLPTLWINGSWSEEGKQPGNAIPVYQYQASLSIPVFTGGRIRSEIASSTLRINRLEREKSELQNQIALEVKTASARLKAALEEVLVADAGLNLAQQEVTQAQDRFQSGVGDNVEVVTAQDILARAYDGQIAALYKENQARANLARALGHIEETYRK
nr:TolC family protein [Terriglobus saanensis]